MKILLIRDVLSNKATTGKLYVDDQFQCFVLEDVVRPDGEKVFGQTAIPYGTYEVVVDYSPKFDRPMPHVLNVPMFEGIRIHSGNVDADTEGCLLVGRIRRTNWVGESRLAYAELFKKLRDATNDLENITLEIIKETPQ